MSRTSLPPPTTPQIPASLPNVISMLRIALIPVCVVLASRYRADPHAASPTGALAVFALIGASDVLDGWLARRFGLSSHLGATLDALADKLAQVSLLVFFALGSGEPYTRVPWWFVALLFGRDLLLGIGALVIKRTHGTVAVAHKGHGRACSLLIFGLLAALLAEAPASWIGPWITASTTLVVLSTGAYVRDGIELQRGG